MRGHNSILARASSLKEGPRLFYFKRLIDAEKRELVFRLKTEKKITEMYSVERDNQTESAVLRPETSL